MPESKKLTRLIQYLDGRAKEAVKRYEGMGSGALTEALNVLKSRFGQSYMIVDAYIDSIVRGPIIVNGDSKGLEKLADECESLKKTLKVMYSDSEINTDHMRRIISCLPYHNQAKWRDVASSIMKKRKSPPNFQDLTEFLGYRDRAENDPIYGRLRDPTKDRRPKQTREENIKSNYFFICACLVIFFDFLQSDWLQERAAFYDILTVVQKSYFFSNKPRSEDNFQTQNTTQKVENRPYLY